MLILEANQKCPHSSKCPYNQMDSCNGANSSRANKFTCEYADMQSVYETGRIRNPLDKTGKMQIIMEGT